MTNPGGAPAADDPTAGPPGPADPPEDSAGATAPEGTDPGTADSTEGQEGSDDGANGDDRLTKARQEAARHRTEKQTVKAELATATEALASAQRAHAESLARDLAQAGDLWMDGATVADCLDDEGRVDPDKVAALVRRQVVARPGLSLHRQHGGGGKGNNSLDPTRPRKISGWHEAAKASKSGYVQSIHDK